MAPITRWHGTIMPIGLWPLARPTAREAPGEPICWAVCPYDRVYAVRNRQQCRPYVTLELGADQVEIDVEPGAHRQPQVETVASG